MRSSLIPQLAKQANSSITYYVRDSSREGAPTTGTITVGDSGMSFTGDGAGFVETIRLTNAIHGGTGSDSEIIDTLRGGVVWQGYEFTSTEE